MEELKEEDVLEFLSKQRGRVKNSDLLQKYKQFLNCKDAAIRAQYRETFRDIINKIALVKQEDGEKYIVLKKKYQHLVQDQVSVPEEKSVLQPPVQQAAVVLWEGQALSSPVEDKVSTAGSTATLAEEHAPLKTKDTIKSLESEDGEEKFEGKPCRNSSSPWSGFSSPTPQIRITEHRDPTGTEYNTQKTMSHSVGWGCPEDSPHEEENVSPMESEVERNSEEPLEEPVDGEEDAVTKGEPDQDGFEDSSSSVGSPSVALDPLEKEWIQCAASARLIALRKLLKQDPTLAYKKGWVSWTALHWAAKHGKEDMVTLVAEAGADVNVKSHGGYTPLHIAALHGHNHIMTLLIKNYGAKQNMRDYSGRLPAQYLKLEDSTVDSSDSSQFQQSRGERRNRKLAGLFLPKSYGQSKKKWGSAEDLTADEKGDTQHLLIPASYKAVRKFSR
ncbi:ankyrin repeat domain-containing protein SOWAHB [Latimeria chalumnae]|uniref:ankyrin repeat domain-containing protein SOWAHB n=1 Tax=Latimeria chalumnae TaxID=7897 RepID=UPI00313E37F7